MRPVLVLDFGAQYNQLIARRIREAAVFCEMVPGDISVQEIRSRDPGALILSGGPASVFTEGAPRPDPAIFDLDLPVLGICYGMQLMAHLLGGGVSPAGHPEYGRRILRVRRPAPILPSDATGAPVWMSHGDRVDAPPPGFQVFADTETTPVAVMGDPGRKRWAVQFHPEVSHTPIGQRILEAFLFDVAGVRADWRPQDIATSAVAEIRRQVPTGHALVALSGGVDSAVAAKLAEHALGERLHAVFVDNGLLRAGEVEEVRAAFPELDLRVADERETFLRALAGVDDPEAKRKIIGRTFIEAFDRVADEVGEVVALVQGTVYPDVIESGGKGAATIKSHHNVGGLPETMRLKVVEPLRWLFKDEVRRVGESLGLPSALVWRHPFPGPGLAVRIVGEVTEERIAIVRAADRIVREEVAHEDVNHRVWQAFAVLLAVRSVGVMGDRRSYGYPIIVRVVESEDGMTADWCRLSEATLERIAHRVVAEVPGVNRVAYDITSKPPGTIEWE